MRHTLRSIADITAVGKTLRGLDYSQPWIVTVQPATDIRSESANRYYWQCIVGGLQRWQESQGKRHTKETIHEYLKSERWGSDVREVCGRMIWQPRRTRKLSPAQFSEYVEWATAHLIDDLGVPPEYLEVREALQGEEGEG